VAPGRQPEYSVTYESPRTRSGPVHLTSLFDRLQPVATRGRPRSSPLCRHDPARPHRLLTCSNRATDGGNLANDLPEWWPYPAQCGQGHPWSPGHVLVSYMRCPVPRRRRHLRAHRGSGARPTAAAQRGITRGTIRPAQRPPRHQCYRPRTYLTTGSKGASTRPPGSHVGSHRHPTQGDSGSTEAFDNRH
jgi:hypothetical protein